MNPVLPSEPLDGDVLDAQHVAAFLGAHVETLRRLARRGAIPAFKVGKDWRFSRKALDHWISARTTPSLGKLALVVDDDERVLRILEMYLHSAHYRVMTAENGEKALDLARQSLPDVVLLDLLMPGMPSVDVLKGLHELDSELAIIIITGYPDSDLLTEALRYPPVTLLPKPVSRDALFHALRRVIHGTERRERPGYVL